MERIIREISLENGLTIRFIDRTHRYYGDFYRVVIEIACDVPLREEYFDNPEEFEAVRKLVGEPQRYRRHLEQMGVPSTEIDRVIDRLIAHFSAHSLPYFNSPYFPRKMFLAESRKKLAKQKHSSPASYTSHG